MRRVRLPDPLLLLSPRGHAGMRRADAAAKHKIGSVGAAAARCLGKAGARVRLPDGPLIANLGLHAAGGD